MRLSGYDYSQKGAYFITICTLNRACLFGEIADGAMLLNETGQIVSRCWQEIPLHFPTVSCDVFVIMPNHIHGILYLVDAIGGPNARAKNLSPLQLSSQSPGHYGTSKTVGSIIRGFKIGVTKRVRECQGEKSFAPTIWQRNYYDHIIRDEDELNRIRQYIANNPVQWGADRNNPHTGQQVATIRKNFENQG